MKATGTRTNEVQTHFVWAWPIQGRMTARAVSRGFSLSKAIESNFTVRVIACAVQ